MIFSSELKKYEQEVSECLDELFSTAYQNQAYPTDLLLIISNGYFDESIKQGFPGLTGFMMGAGKNHEEFTELTQYKFYDDFRKSHLDLALKLTTEIKSYEEYLSVIKENKSLQELEENSINFELIVYQKLWETDLLLIRLAQLVGLVHGENYNWSFKFKDSSNLIKNKIINKSKALPKFHSFIKKNYFKELRNAIAHSQYYLTSRRLHVHQPAVRINLTFDDWSVIFHKLILFYNFYIKELKKYDEMYVLKYRQSNSLKVRLSSNSDRKKKTFDFIEVEYFEKGKRWSFRQI